MTGESSRSGLGCSACHPPPLPPHAPPAASHQTPFPVHRAQRQSHSPPLVHDPSPPLPLPLLPYLHHHMHCTRLGNTRPGPVYSVTRLDCAALTVCERDDPPHSVGASDVPPPLGGPRDSGFRARGGTVGVHSKAPPVDSAEELTSANPCLPSLFPYGPMDSQHCSGKKAGDSPRRGVCAERRRPGPSCSLHGLACR